MIHFRIFGIPVQIQPFFWVTLALIGGALRANSADAILRLGLFVLAGFVSILVHELGHALTARRFGAWSEITLHGFGGLASYSGARMTRTRSFLITLGGPVFQLALAMVIQGGLFLSQDALIHINENLLYLLIITWRISVVWALINLLPVWPLDGGQMLHAVLGPQRFRITLWVTIFVALGAAVLMYLHMNASIFALLLCYFAWQAGQALRENRFH